MHNLEKLKPLALLLLRWALAFIFISHGYPKLFTQAHELLQAFPKMGFPAYFVYVVGVVEFFGGCLLVLGLFTRIVGLLQAGEMAVAIWRVHWVQGPASIQFPLVVGVGAFTLLILGAGTISLDWALFKGKA